MRHPAALVLALLLLAYAGCASSDSARDEIIVGTAETADFVGTASRRLFYELPVMLLWEAPKAVFYELPRSGIIALGGRRARVEDLLDQLAASPGPEREFAVSEHLQDLTGIPIRSGSAWLAWWEAYIDVPPDDWLPTFVNEQVGLLGSHDYFTRASSIAALRTLYGIDLGYDPKADGASIAAGAARWREALEAGALPAARSAPF